MNRNYSPKINEFQTDLAFSHEDELLNAFYYQQFPSLVKIELVTDLDLQKQGVDKVLHLASGKEIWIEEKTRRQKYNDILIEMWSVYPENGKHGVVGWIGSHKKSDYLVYQFPEGEIYLFPFLLLQKAYLRNGADWVKTYGERFAQNKGYKSCNVPVPIPALLQAIQNEMVYSMTQPHMIQPAS